MNWKISLDKYLTTPYDDGFEDWANKVIEYMSDDFYNKNEDWINKDNGQCNKWLNKIFYNKCKEPKISATIIERSYKLYKKYA